MTGYEAFSLYHTLRLHFTSKYDFVKYNGKCNITIEAFENRKDKYYFYRLSRRQEREDFIQFLVSNFLIDEKIWVGKLTEEESILAYKDRLSVIQSLSYVFSEDCRKIKDVSGTKSFNELLKTDGEYPKLLTMALRKEIHLETLCILNALMNFFPMWNKKISDTIQWPNFHRKCVKYMPFLEFDRERMKSIALKELQ